METENENRLLRKIYSEILGGFSVVKYHDSDVYIKHFNSIDNLEIDYLYLEFFDEAVKRGYLTEKDKIDSLKKDFLWKDEDDLKVESLKQKIKDLALSKRKSYLKRDIDSINSQIKNTEDEFIELITKKENLVGATAEKFAKRNVDSYFISQSFFKDKSFNTFLFNKKGFDELDKYELDELFVLYYTISSFLSEKYIRKIALQDFFQSVYYLAENTYQFFGKPIATLTFHQVQLCAYGNYYKTILNGDPKPPEDIISDPDKLEDWYRGKATASELLKSVQKNNEGENAILVGMTNEDRKFLGIEESKAQEVHDEIKKNGGELNLMEILKYEGLVS